MSDEPYFLQSEFANGGDEALFQVLPVPLERSVSFGTGTQAGPRRLLEASAQLEIFDGYDVPGARGIATLPVHDCSGPIEAVLESLSTRVQRLWQLERLPVLLGGEHTLTWAPLLAAVRHFGAKAVGLVQIDAHADLRESYQGDRYSHACVAKRCLDLGVAIHQLGVRSLSPAEQDLRLEHDAISYQDALELHQQPNLSLPPNFPQLVYLSVDVDGLDPAVIPATGTPEPGGLSWYTCLALVQQLAAQRRVLGFDLVELAPEKGRFLSEFVAARLTYQLMGILGRSHDEW